MHMTIVLRSRRRVSKLQNPSTCHKVSQTLCQLPVLVPDALVNGALMQGHPPCPLQTHVFRKPLPLPRSSKDGGEEARVLEVVLLPRPSLSRKDRDSASLQHLRAGYSGLAFLPLGVG